MKTHTSNIKRGMLSLTAIALSSSLSHAATSLAVSNLGQAKTAGLGVATFQSVGASFTVGSGYSAWSLESITLSAEAFSSPTDNFIVELRADVSGNPSWSPLLTFTGSNPSAEDLYTYFPSSPFTLSAGNTYWITARSNTHPMDGTYGWNGTSSLAESDALTGWTIGNKHAVNNVTETGAIMQFSVNATGLAVPETSSLALLSLGGVAAFRRRRA